MANYVLYGHLETIKVSKGQSLKGNDVVGIIGTTGNSTGKHLHYGYTTKGSSVNYFYNTSTTSDPGIMNSKYGEPSPNDVTLGYNSSEYPYNTSNRHAGIDYSGVIDKSYETSSAKVPAKANATVISTGDQGNANFGKYVILKLEDGMTKPTFKNRPKMTDMSVGANDKDNELNFDIDIECNSVGATKTFIRLFKVESGKVNRDYYYTIDSDSAINYKVSGNTIYAKQSVKAMTNGLYIVACGIANSVGSDYQDLEYIRDTGRAMEVIENNPNIDLFVKDGRVYVEVTK